MHGNSLLLHVGGTRYVFIGHNIYMFDAGDTILKYYSPVGHSHTNTPYAIGSKYSFALIPGTRMKNSLLATPLGRTQEPGREFWDRRPELQRIKIIENFHGDDRPTRKTEIFDFGRGKK